MMVRRMAWVSALLLAMAGLNAAADELVVFKEYRALIVQSHRVEGDWTYLRIGSGEMAVPSATILTFAQEQGVSAVRASYSAPPSAMTPAPQQVQPAVIPPPFHPGLPNRVRMISPDQPSPDDQDEEEEKGDVEDEGADSEAPAIQPQVPGRMPMINPNVLQKGPAPQTQQPIDQQH